MTKSIFFLCVLQGVLEFLPVSSSSHIMLFQDKLEVDYIMLNISLHLGTLLTFMVYFYKDIYQISRAFLRHATDKKLNDAEEVYKDWGLALIIATFPALFIGMLIKRLGLEGKLAFLWLAGVSSIIFGILLYVSDRFSGKVAKTLSTNTGLAIGLAQLLAFIPGASRSGVCITMGRFLGLSREDATRFSFLLAIPTVLGAVILSFYYAIEQENIIINYRFTTQMFVITFSVGLLAVHWIFNFLKNHGFLVFAIYRVCFGIVLLILWYYQSH